MQVLVEATMPIHCLCVIEAVRVLFAHMVIDRKTINAVRWREIALNKNKK